MARLAKEHPPADILVNPTPSDPQQPCHSPRVTVAIDVRQILRDRPGSFVGYFLPLLMFSQENDKLLDVVELFGLDRLAECIERLGGSEVAFPTWETVDTLVADAYLLYLLDNRHLSRKTLEQTFDAPYEGLVARAKALRSTLKEERDFPGQKAAEGWRNRLQRIREEIRTEVDRAELHKDAGR